MPMLDTFLDKWETQLRKGVLEYAVLLSLRREAQYGFELITGIERACGLNIPEGTLYPLMLRLVKEGLVASEWSLPTESEPPRKYYQLTRHGASALKGMTARWQALNTSMETLIDE